MCYQLVLVSALTVSEVRSMLPPGVRADIVPPPADVPFRRLRRGAQAAVHLRVGRCACRLVPGRFAGAHSDEAHLRAMHRQRGTPRGEMPDALDRHRAGAGDGELVAPGALRDFVAEHARNAGPAIYVLGFGAGDDVPDVPASLATVDVASLGSDAGWLREDAGVTVTR